MIINILTFLTAAYDFTETINVIGSGKMLAETDTSQAKDMAQGSGDQYYYRELISKPDHLSLTSEYNITKSDGVDKKFYLKDAKGRKTGIYQIYMPNRYSISMKSPGGIQHTVSVSSYSISNSSPLSSKSQISFNAPTEDSPSSETGITTNYNIEGAGNLSEVLLDSTSGRHPREIAGTSIDSVHFKISSSVSDDAGLQGSDASTMLDSLNKVSLPTESGKPNTNDLDELNSKFDNNIISPPMYISGLKEKWESGKIDSNALLDSLKKQVENGKIEQKDFDGIRSYIMNRQEKASSTDRSITFVESELKNKLITSEEYLGLINQMWKGQEITDTIYLDKLKTLKEKGNITDTEYSNLKKEVFAISEPKSNIDLVLQDIEDQYSKNITTKEEYLSKLHELWIGWQIDSTQYQKILKARQGKSPGIDIKDLKTAQEEIFAREYTT
jgi:hypothetical protein